MGQKLGKASFDEAIIPFLNLPAPAINALWTAFNLTAEGWGLRLDVFATITKPLSTFLNADDPTMQTYCKQLFDLMDTDMNGIVDALEYICTLAMLSAMEPRDKIRFVFTVYDFSEKGTLLIDEITLSVKSTVEGLCKVSKLKPPSVKEYESLSRLAFASCGKTPSSDDSVGNYLTLSEFLAYVNASPTTNSWMGYYDDINDGGNGSKSLESKENENDENGQSPNSTLLTPGSDFIDSDYDDVDNLNNQLNNTTTGTTGVGVTSLKVKPVSGVGSWYRAPIIDENYVPSTEEGAVEGGDDVKYLDKGTPCYAALTELLKPEGKIKPLLTVPDSQLELEWVYGVSTSCRQHIRYLQDGSIVYPTGSIAVTYRFPTEDGDGTATQSFYTEHGDMVSALSVSPNGHLIATADSKSTSNGLPKVMLWKGSEIEPSVAAAAAAASNGEGSAVVPPTNGITVASLGSGLWTRGCPPFALHFSPDGTKLLSLAIASRPPPTPINKGILGVDSGNTSGTGGNATKVVKSYIVAVHDTTTRACLFSINVDAYGAVFDAKWCASTTASQFKAKGGVGGGYGGPASSFCLATSRGIVFFSPSESSGSSGSYEARRGVGARAGSGPEAHVSLIALDGAEEMVAGGMSGTLFRYEGRSVAACAKAHTGAITAVKYINAFNNSGGGKDERLYSGSLDASIKVWEPRMLTPLATIDLMTLGSSLGREVISLDISNNGTKLLVGTSGAEVWELGLSIGGGGDGEDGDDNGDAEVLEGGVNANIGQPLHGDAPLFNGHFDQSVAGLVSNPSSTEFATGGSDGTIRIYDAAMKTVVRMQRLSTGQPITTLAFNPDGSFLLAGVGGGVDVLDPNNIGSSERISRLDIDAAMTNVKKVNVLMIRFSPDGSLCLFLDNLGKLGIFVAGSWSMKKIHDIPNGLLKDYDVKCEDICDVDISEDNVWLQIGTNKFELFYFNLDSGEIAKDGYKTVKLANGKFPSCGPGPSKIAYEKQESHPLTCKSPSDLSCVTASPTASLQLAGDKDGNMHLYHYPSLAPVVSALALVAAATAGEPVPKSEGVAAGGSCWKAHTHGGVSGLAFISGDENVCSAGYKDLTIQQWKLQVSEQRNDDNAQVEEGEGGGDDGDEDNEEGGVVLQDVEDVVLEGEDYVSGSKLGQLDQSPLFLALKSKDIGTVADIISSNTTSTTVGKGTTSTTASSSPWSKSLSLFKDNIAAPSYPPKASSEPPSVKLELDWVYGANLKSSLGSVRYSSNGKIVYPAASLVVVLNKATDTDNASQLLIPAHSEETTCLAVYGDIIASGQKGPDVHVTLSSASTGRVLKRLYPRVNGKDTSNVTNGNLAQCVTACCFSHDGKTIAFTTADDDNTLHLYGVDDGELRGCAPSGDKKVLCLSFSPDGSGELLQGGIDHFAVWNIRGRSMGKRRGLFGPECPKQAILSCCWIPSLGEDLPPVALLGAQDGNVLKLDGRTVAEVSKACQGGIGAMSGYKPLVEDGPCLCIGGRDGQVLLCGSDLAPIITINLRDKKYKCFRWAVRSVCLNKDQRKVLIGTAGSEVFEISASDEAVDINDGSLVQGHCRGSLEGIASHPLIDEFATCGDDKTLRLWNASTHEMIRMLSLPSEASSCCYSPDGYLIAVGLKLGGVVIVSLLKPELDIVKELRSEGSGGKVSAVRFSANGRILAAAADNGNDSSVVFYDCENTASPGGAFTLKSKFDLAAVSTTCGHAAAQAVRISNSNESNANATDQVESNGDDLLLQGGTGNKEEEVAFSLMPTQPCTIDFCSGDSSVLQYGTLDGSLVIHVDSGGVIGQAAASKEALNFNDKVSKGEVDTTNDKSNNNDSGGGGPLTQFTALSAAKAIMLACANTYKDEKWSSYTLPMGWSCQGIYGPGTSTNSILAVSRSGDHSFMCTGDIYGRTNIFKWPPILPSLNDISTEKDDQDLSSNVSENSSNNTLSLSSIGGQAPCRSFSGHGGAVGGVVFVKGDSVATIGCNDRTVILWKCVKYDNNDNNSESGGDENRRNSKQGTDELDEDVDFDQLEALEEAKAAKLLQEEANEAAIEDAITDPNVMKTLLAKAPILMSKMANANQPSFVFGVSTFRGNMFVNGDGNPLYCAGGLGIIYQRKVHSQLMMKSHSVGKAKGKGYLESTETGGLIRVLKYSEPSNSSGSSGGGRSSICVSGDALGDVIVWDSSTGVEKCQLPRGLHANSEIATLAITSSGGNQVKSGLLVTIGDDVGGTMGVWESPSNEWNHDVVLLSSASTSGVSSSSSNSKSLFACFAEGAPFLPCEKQVAYTFATGGGQGGIQFWSICCGNLSSEKGSFIDNVIPEETCTCAVSLKSPPSPQVQVAKMTSTTTAGRNSTMKLELVQQDQDNSMELLMVVGGASGRLMLWEGVTCGKVLKAHDSAVTDVRSVKLDVSPLTPVNVSPSNTNGYEGRVGVVSGSLDGTIKVFALMNETSGGKYLALTSSFDLNNEVVPRPIRSAVVAVAPDQGFTKLLVLTASGEVIEVVRDSRAATQLFSAHTQMYQGMEIAGGEVIVTDRNQKATQSNNNKNDFQKSVKQIEGCCAHARHPTELDLLVTGGGDGTLRLWSQSGKCVLSILEVSSPIHALTWFIPKAVDGTTSKENANVSVDENGEAIHSLAVVLAPTGKVLQIALNLNTMEMTNLKILIPTISPVPDYIVGCISGPRIFKTSAKVIAGRFGETEDIVKHFAMASGSVIDDSSAAKATFPTKNKDMLADIEPAGACVFLY